jgi:hypothetical protein
MVDSSLRYSGMVDSSCSHVAPLLSLLLQIT